VRMPRLHSNSARGSPRMPTAPCEPRDREENLNAPSTAYGFPKAEHAPTLEASNDERKRAVGRRGSKSCRRTSKERS